MNNKPTKKIITPWLLVVFIIVLVIGVGFYAWYYFYSKTATPTTTPTAKTSIDETADWQTYTNDTYGFSFEYPLAWSIKEETQNNFKLSLTSPEMSKNIENGILDASSEIYLQIKQNDNLSLGQFIEKDAGGNEIVLSQKEVKINNYPAFKCVLAGMSDQTVYYWTRDQKTIFIFSAWTQEDILDKIISTFQFTK